MLEHLVDNNFVVFVGMKVGIKMGTHCTLS